MTPVAPQGPLRLLVVQPTPFCNLDCDYCYLQSRDDRSRLSLGLLEATLNRVLESSLVAGPFTLLWHAGEPLTVPPSFYDAASASIQATLKKHGRPVDLISQSLQTNGIGINSAWCDCFRRNGIHVGISLDGPDFLHDAHRRTRSGHPTHAAVMRAVGMLQLNDIPFNVIAVLTNESLDHADAMYDFFAMHGIENVGFNMEEAEGSNVISSLDRLGAEQRYVRFMQRFWERCMREPGRVRLREFEGITHLTCSGERLGHTDMNRPFAIVNVDARGGVSTFDPELLGVQTERYGDFIFGNVQTDSLNEVALNPGFQRVRDEIAAGVEACRATCAYFGLCGGGAGSNKYWEHGRLDSSVTQHCRYRIQLVADVVLNGMERELGLTA